MFQQIQCKTSHFLTAAPDKDFVSVRI